MADLRRIRRKNHGKWETSLFEGAIVSMCRATVKVRASVMRRREIISRPCACWNCIAMNFPGLKDFFLERNRRND